MAKPEYPLKQIMEVKQKRVEDAEKVLNEKITLLEKEQQKLKECEAARDKELTHYNDKLTQLRQSLDEEMLGPKIEQMKVYLKVVQERLKAEEKKVEAQRQQVAAAEKSVEEAREVLRLKRAELDKLQMHFTDWKKAQRKELEIIEGREQDELGNLMYGKRR